MNNKREVEAHLRFQYRQHALPEKEIVSQNARKYHISEGEVRKILEKLKK